MTTLNIVIAEIILCLVLAWLLGYFISWLFAKGAKTKYESEIQELQSGIEERDSNISKLDDDNIQYTVALRENQMELMVANDKIKKTHLELNEANSKLKLTTDKLKESEDENKDLKSTIALNNKEISTLKEKNSQIKERLTNSINEFDISLNKQKEKISDMLVNEEKNLLEITKLKDENRELKLITQEPIDILNTTKKIEELYNKNNGKELKVVVKKYASLLETAVKAKQGTIDYLKAELEKKDNELKKALEVNDNKTKENPLIDKIFDKIQKIKS
ncbi:Chromosome partition protein smc [hydrothermal vent metagenome]|uniref:Chromosome partition protein smc n=1 Tax=hydrothermal vent metagenome TaxID=652676 RepID=A0A1W1C8S3_9ZZZZ